MNKKHDRGGRAVQFLQQLRHRCGVVRCGEANQVKAHSNNVSQDMARQNKVKTRRISENQRSTITLLCVLVGL